MSRITLTGAKAWYVEKEGAWTHFESAEWVRLRDEMQSTMDREKRKAAARKVQEMALDECFTIVVSDSPKPWAYTPQVKDFTYDLNNAPFSGEIWPDKESEAFQRSDPHPLFLRSEPFLPLGFLVVGMSRRET